MKEKLKEAAWMIVIGALIMVGFKAVDWIIPSPAHVITVKVER